MQRLFLFLILLFPVLSSGQQPLINTPHRNTTSLDGAWNYIVDPYETGYYNYRQEPYDQQKDPSNSAFFMNYHAVNKAELVEYDFDKSPAMAIPGDWNSQRESLSYYEGTVWFKRSFDYVKQRDSNRMFVHFGAVNYQADVYLNGKKLGSHTGGFTPFSFEVTQVLRATGNFLVVKVDNRRHKDAIPTVNTDWWNYGGITREVSLIEEPATFIQDYFVQLKKGRFDVVTGHVQLASADDGELVHITIPELGIRHNVRTERGYASFDFGVKGVKLWSPEVPKLYEVVVETRFQRLRDEIGFRSIHTEGPNIFLNGKSIFLRGISIHEENSQRGARAYSEADALVALTWAKELGCNYVRLAHYPHNEHMVRMADRMGLMVWEEIPVYWTVDFSSAKALASARQQLTEAITRDKNRASIIIWSMANETPPSALRNTFLRNLIEHSKTLDSTRLLSAALEKHEKEGDPSTQIMDDSIGEYLDVVAFNQYIGWYGGKPSDAPNARWDIRFNKPVVMSEFGGDALQGLHGGRDERWTEEYQEYLYQQTLLMTQNIPNLRGISPWILADFRSPKRLLPGVQDGWNRKGLISNRGIKKKAFYTLREFYEKTELQYR